MRVIDMADIIRAMQNETQFVLRCEEVFHDKISSAAASILSAQPQKPFVCLTGPSGSGKTTTAMRLKAYLENLGVKVCQISMDNFFLPLDQRPPEATDWESPYCVNRELLLDTVDKLSRGETAQPLRERRPSVPESGSGQQRGKKWERGPCREPAQRARSWKAARRRT